MTEQMKLALGKLVDAGEQVAYNYGREVQVGNTHYDSMRAAMKDARQALRDEEALVT